MALINNINGYQGQITYQDFSEELKNNPSYNILSLIAQSSIISDANKCHISRIGIQAIPGDQFKLTNYSPGSSSATPNIIKIGKTGFYEANDVEITEICYTPKNKDTNSEQQEERSGHDVIIDYIIKQGV